MEWAMSFWNWVFMIGAVLLFLFVVYLIATDQLQDFLTLVGFVFATIAGGFAVLFGILFVIFLNALPFLVVIGGSLLLVKCIFF